MKQSLGGRFPRTQQGNLAAEQGILAAEQGIAGNSGTAGLSIAMAVTAEAAGRSSRTPRPPASA